MSALEVGEPATAASSQVADQVELDRARFALSIRERRLLLAAGDFVVGGLAVLIAYTLVHRDTHHPLQPYDPLLYGAIWVVALLLTDGYAFEIPTRRLQSAIAVVRAAPIAALSAVFTFFIHPYVLTRPVIVLAMVLGSAGLILMRITVARLLLHEALAVRAVLLSDTEPPAELMSTLHAARFECRVIATLVGPVESDADRAALLTKVSDLIKRSRAQELILSNNELQLMPGLVEECLTHGVRVVSGGDLVERYMGRVPVDSVDVHWYLGLPDNDLWKRPYAFARRISDLVLSFVFSLPFLILLPFIALAIKLDSPGPVLHFQRRMGADGKEFDLIKLRTMKQDAEAEGGAQFTARSDPRITRVGRFLRITRLDEFPQLLNIVKGDMSFIGPRPERPEFMADLEAKIPHFRSRLLIKPGLTGWAQVRGGYASTVPELTRKLEYDLYYVKNRSLRLDLQILASTFLTVVLRRGR